MPRVVAFLVLLVAFGLLSTSLGCSPAYVIRAGWEEAGILWRRENIEELIAADETEDELKEKLALVLEVRDWAAEKTLKAGGSFTQYSEIDREILVWVLSASPKTKLAYYTWWFPIVGRVPYKGFFDKEDGIEEAKDLSEDGHDIFLRPSPAFSTLGWFNDPLLSTLVRYDDISLANTVIHEILHNTVWIPNHAAFNETLANVVGSVGVKQFYEDKEGAESTKTKEAADRWHDELLYARFLDESVKKLEVYYESLPENTEYTSEKAIAGRKILFDEIRTAWAEQQGELRTKRYLRAVEQLNNAVILAQKVYLDRPWLIHDLLLRVDESLPRFVEEIELLKTRMSESNTGPYEALEARLAEFPEELGK